MLPHQERVVTERDDLRQKIAKLNAFFDTETFSKLDKGEQRTLHNQEHVMCQYEHILNSRIAVWEKG